MMTNKTIRVRLKTHEQLLQIKHLLERKEDRVVSLDEVIRKALEKLEEEVKKYEEVP